MRTEKGLVASDTLPLVPKVTKIQKLSRPILEQKENDVNTARGCDIRSFSARSPRPIESNRVFEIARARKTRAQRSQIMLIAFAPACGHARPLHRRHWLGRDGIPRLHHQAILAGVVHH